MNKKADVEAEFIVWVFRIFVVGVIVVFIYVATYNYLSSRIDTTEFENSLLASKLLYSPSCLAYESDKPLPGIIDIKKFTKENLRDCYDKKDFGYVLTLKDLNNTKINSIEVLNEEQKMFFPICKGNQYYDCSTKEKYVLIKENEELKPTFLVVEVIKRV